MAGRFSGIIYASAEVAMRMRGVKRSDMPAMFDALRAMERAALPLLNREK